MRSTVRLRHLRGEPEQILVPASSAPAGVEQKYGSLIAPDQGPQARKEPEKSEEARRA